MFGWIRRRRRRRLIDAGLAAESRDALADGIWQYPRLSKSQRDKLDDWVAVFLAERNWEGCGGLTLDTAVRTIIAGQAGLTVLGHEDWYFDHTASILVYPGDYTAKNVARPAGGGLTLVSDEDRAGEAWYRGPVVLSLPDIIQGGRSPHYGRNLVVHEFAHQLDMIGDPSADGTPPLSDATSRQLWKTVVPREFARLQHQCQSGTPSLLNCYGATNPAEFFAVSSEMFFQRPTSMHQGLPQLFQALKAFYRIDPRHWE